MPQTTLSERGWKGLYTNASPHDIPAGAALAQTNMLVVSPGILRCRRGVVALPWSLSPADSEAVTAMFRFDTQFKNFIIYQRADGTIKAAYDGGTIGAIIGTLGGYYNSDGTQPINLGFAAGYPACAVRTRQGFALVVNGWNWPFTWNGLDLSGYIAGIQAPPTPAVSLGSGGGLSAGQYQWAVRFVRPDGVASSLSPAVVETATAGQSATVTTVYSAQMARLPGELTTELWRTTVAEALTYYRVATSASSGTVPAAACSFTDDVSDATLIANALANPALALPVTNPDGSLNAYRQGLPPMNKPFLAANQNRLFAWGNVTYSTGTISVTNGSAVVTGSGVVWPPSDQTTNSDDPTPNADETQDPNGRPGPLNGRQIVIDGDVYTIAYSGPDSDALTLTTVYGGGDASGLSYTIMPAASDLRTLYYTEAGEPESWPPTNVAGIQNNTLDNDAETGLMSFNSMLYALLERHIYQITYVEQGTIIITALCIANRGCLNNSCWLVTTDLAYLIDQFGAYAFNGQSCEPISAAIQDLWINGTLDFTKSAGWFASWEPVEKIVRFHVNYVGDSGAGCTRTIAWCQATKSWATESYPMALGAACRTDVGSMNRLAYGGMADNLLLASQGLSDVVAAAIVGTVTTGGSNSSITDANAAFTSAVDGAPVAITRGAAKGQVGIATYSSGTEITVSGFTVAPGAGDTYAIGAIQYDYQTGRHPFIASQSAQDVMRNREALVCHASTANAATLDVRRYVNHDTTPKFWQPGPSRHVGVVYDQNGPNAVVNLLSTQFNGGSDPGYKPVDFPGASGGPMADRWVMLELTGFQTLDAIQLYSLELAGIVG